jgi:tetratricopeptide (TPR) repeat protein
VKSDLQEKALKLELKGRFEEAAQLYIEAGRHEKAAFMYQKAGNPTLAMRTYADGGFWIKAAEMAQKQGDHAQTAVCFEKGENLPKAAEAYEKAGNFRKAAELHQKCGNHEKAADMYFKSGDYLRAGGLWEKSKKEEQAIQAYRQYLVESAGIIGQLTGPDAQRIGQLFIKAKDYVRAAEIFLKTAEPLKALFLLMEAGETARSIELYKQKFKGQGFNILSQITKDTVVDTFGEVCMAAGEFPEAAQCFDKAGNTLRAAEAYQSSGDLYQSAELFLRAGKFKEAAGLFEESGHCSEAADLYYKLKDFNRAAACYEKEGDLYKAGRLYQYINQNQKAIQLLQKITHESAEYLKASILICKAFVAVDLADMARKRYQEICRDYPVGEETLEIYYDFAEMLATMGDSAGAKEVYEKIVNVDLTYKDVAQKLKKLTAGVPRPSAPAAQMPLMPPVAIAPPAPAAARSAAPPAPVPAAKPAPPPPSAPKAAPPRKDDKATRAINILRKFPFFQNLEESEIQTIWSAVERKEVSAGDVMIQSGEYAPGFFLLVQGSIALYSPMGRAIITLSEPGTLFGVAAYFSGETSAVTIRATETSKLICVQGKELMEILGRNPAFRDKIKPLFSRSLEKEVSSIPPKTPYHMQILEAKKRLM